jgi:BMFP domain-containing protein YqiC
MHLHPNLYPHNHDLKEIIMVDQKKFDELVVSTTKYLQDLLDRVNKLENQLAELKVKKAKKDD